MADDMAKVRYTGPYTEVFVPALDRRVAQGEVIEVPLAVAASLAEQEGIWAAVGQSKGPIEDEQQKQREAGPVASPKAGG
jgi:hypothetical protein